MSEDQYEKTNWTPEIWTGSWRWIEAEANFTEPGRQIVAQTCKVRVEGLSFWINQQMTLKDGAKMSWTWDGKFDGIPRPITMDHDGGEMIPIAFYVIDENYCGDSYIARDGSKVGSEYIRFGQDRIDIWGCYTVESKTQFPYFEAWERIG